MNRADRAGEIVRLLRAEFPRPRTALDYRTPFQLLVATILSAQCTDARVNLVTPALFRRYPDAEAMARADIKDLEGLVRSTGFFHAKAKSIKGCSSALVRDHGGKLPREIDAMVKLPGVGRKTANVVLGSAFGIASGVVVDTHVKRLAGRMGLSTEEDPEKIEADLMKLVPQKDWVDFGHLMVLHGRKTCAARKPACDKCAVAGVCPSAGKV